MDMIHTVFYFIVAIGLLVSIHEFGHFWVARKVGVKVLRFSIGFGKVIWSHQKTPDSTEYVLSAIPLGGYVKMVDEREGDVDIKDLPFSFNRQSLLARTAIVAAGPLFNLILAVALFWAVFMIGQTGMRPIVGSIEVGTLAADAGFQEGEEILYVNGDMAPTWTEAMNLLFSTAMQGEQDVTVVVKSEDEVEKTHIIKIPEEGVEKAEILYERLGLKPWTPVLKPIIGQIIDNLPAQLAGLQTGDLIVSADGELMTSWMQWVDYVRSRPNIAIQVELERKGVRSFATITPEIHSTEESEIGRIGAGVKVPEALLESLRVKYSLSPGDALAAAFKKTWFFSTSTLQMMWKMVKGKASTENLSGPISIAQYAGQSAERGLVPFFNFLALVSISLGVLNLLPIPVLDGGHLLFFAVEAIKGSPVSDRIQIIFQQFGMLVLMSLMFFTVFLDVERLFQ